MSETSNETAGPGKRAQRTVVLAALGVVFADIGTSPLYAYRDALDQVGATPIGPNEILGVLSLAIWSLIIVVSIKYVLLLLRANNQGEGGVLALAAIARRGGSRDMRHSFHRRTILRRHDEDSTCVGLARDGTCTLRLCSDGSARE